MNYEKLTTHYLELAEQMLDEAFGENRAQWIHDIEAELPKIRSIFAWLKEQHTEEGLGLIQDFLVMGDVDEPSSLQAGALDLAGAFSLSLNNFELARSLKSKAL